MIVMIEYGRLGNQIFQFLSIRTIYEKEKIYLIGFDSLRETYHLPRAKRLVGKNTRLYRLIVGRIRPFLDYLLPKIRIVTVISILEGKESRGYSVRRGLVAAIKYVCTGHPASEDSFSSQSATSLRMRGDLASIARRVVQKIRKTHPLVFFLHIRRGDYLRWPSVSAPAVLPMAWYRRAVEAILVRYPNAAFLVCTDDFQAAIDEYHEEPNFYVSDLDDKTDFAMMTMCDGGILSASTFAWWAAYFSRINGTGKAFLAPYYWAGHRSRRWYPADPGSPWLEYASVDAIHTQLDSSARILRQDDEVM